MVSVFFYQTSIGRIGIVANKNAITNLYFNDKQPTGDIQVEETELLQTAGRQLKEYLSGQRKRFSLPIAPQGTEFQQTVWQMLQQIPYGKTWSYQQVAQAIGRPKASRAVGMANNKNPLPIIIPCHRVIGANGQLVGYGGGLALKETLLQLEKTHAYRS